jgi:hypothetical protein
MLLHTVALTTLFNFTTLDNSKCEFECEAKKYNILKEAVLNVMFSAQPWYQDATESITEREQLYEPLAYEIAKVVINDKDRLQSYGGYITVAGALITLAYEETRFARYVLEGRCKEGPDGSKCDPDRNGEPRARGAFQLWKRACPNAYEFPAGSRESLVLETECAEKLLIGSYSRCHNGWIGAFSGYARGTSCSWKGGAKRQADTYHRASLVQNELNENE